MRKKKEIYFVANDFYTVEISEDKNFDLSGKKNHLASNLYETILHYDDDNDYKDDMSSVLHIAYHKMQGPLEHDIALIEEYPCIVEKGAVLSQKELFVLEFEKVIVIDLEGQQIIREIDLSIDYMGQFFEIHPYKEDFILYGELYIIRLKKDGRIAWSFSGRDIFVCPDNHQKPFVMKENSICLKDWLGYSYEINYNGEEM